MCVSVVKFSGQVCLYTLWCLKLRGLLGLGFGDRVLCWFDFGQGVNKYGEEALVTYRPTDNISGSRDLSAKPGCDIHTTLGHSMCTLTIF